MTDSATEMVERVARAIRGRPGLPYVNGMTESDARIAARAAIEAMREPSLRVRHVKRGSTYRVIGSALVQTDTLLSDMDEVIVYECEHDGTLWARRASEFEDGRFEEIATALLPEKEPSE